MNMQDLLGLDAGDFEGVEFVDSSDSDEDQQLVGRVSAAAAVVPSAGRSGANDSNVKGRPSEATQLSLRTAAPAAPSSSTAEVTATVAQPGDTGLDTGIPGSKSVDAVRGSPLPEHASGQENALSLLRRVERCCLESNSAEVEKAVATLSSCLGHSAHGVGSSASGEASGGAGEGVSRGSGSGAASLWGMSPRAVEAALSACRAALQLCRGEYEQLLRETALFAASSKSPPSVTPLAEGVVSQGGDGMAARVKAFVIGGNGTVPTQTSTAAASGGGGSTTSTPGEPTANGRAAADVPGENSTAPAALWRAAEAMWAGAAALCLFWQENYSGPELGSERARNIDAFFAEELGLACSGGGGGGSTSAQEVANVALACDGELPYPKSSLAGSLLVARVILTALAEETSASRATRATTEISTPALLWSASVTQGQRPPAVGGVVVVGGGGKTDGSEYISGASEGEGEGAGEREHVRRTFGDAAGGLSSVSWWSARACVTQGRLLLSSNRSETLWTEALGLFGRAVGLFGGGVASDEEVAAAAMAKEQEGRRGGGGGEGVANDLVRRRVAGLVWLEWGLAQHHFQDASKGKESFARAKMASGLTAGLTGALGKRTKNQQSQVAQLVLVASSACPAAAEASEAASGETALFPPPQSPAFATVAAVEEEESKKPSAAANGGVTVSVVEAVGAGSTGGNKGVRICGDGGSDGGSAAGLELGETTAIGEGGMRAAARRTVHAADSELLEDIAFVERDLENPGKLQDVDLAIILGLCLDVSNSNPRDGLTNEQMTPYIARVLRQPGCNWMIYSTALLQRAWVEFERSHARDRAALQLQALLDQHTTKLTYTQSTTETVEDSAPAQDRLRFLSCLSFPPRWELRRDLAQRYAGIGVLGSAAEEFVDLEMWEDAVECYRQMQQIHKAEKIARDRLQEKETPPMLAALGDLTQDPELWERAWELSGGRYARAKASLGRMRLREAKYEEACGHYEQALAVKPLLTSAWFSLGVARMRVGRWPEALRAFSTVAQQEPEEGEAWGNMGAVHMHEGNWAGAAASFAEGLKQMPTNWRMWENQAEALIRLGRWSSAVYACHRMLDLSDKSKRGVDAEFLALLVEGALSKDSGDETTMSPSSSSPGETPTPTPVGAARAGVRAAAGDDLVGRPLCKQVAELLGRVVSSSSTRGEPRVWEVYARFNEGTGRDRSKVLDCVSKQCRAIQRAGWEKDAAAVERLAKASEKLVTLYLEDNTRQSAYQAKMHLATAARKVKAADVCAGCPGHELIFSLLHNVEEILAELKRKEALAAGAGET